jgi:hypothetical protein
MERDWTTLGREPLIRCSGVDQTGDSNGLGRAGAEKGLPNGGHVSLKDWMGGTAEDAKEGGNYGAAPQEIAAKFHEAARGAKFGAGLGLDHGFGRLPGRIRGHDAAYGPVHAR